MIDAWRSIDDEGRISTIRSESIDFEYRRLEIEYMMIKNAKLQKIENCLLEKYKIEKLEDEEFLKEEEMQI